MARKKKADEIRQLYNLANNWTRQQWEHINQKGYEFAHDEQLNADEKGSLEEQGMPTFTINRILPVVEMLNFYATSNDPRWQAIGVDGSDSDVAAVISDLTDYVWANANGSTLYTNAINDAVTKGVGYILVNVDKDADNGMGEVTMTQPEPFDVYVDPKSRDMLFRDAAYILIRKVLPKNHVMKLYPDHVRKIKKASSDDQSQHSYSVRNMGDADQKMFHFNDSTQDSSMASKADGSQDELCELFEVYEKIKLPYVNMFYRIPPTEEQLKMIQKDCQEKVAKFKEELLVGFMEQDQQMMQALQSGQMIQERYELEKKKAQEMMENQIKTFETECMSKLQEAQSRVENQVIAEAQYKILLEDETVAQNIIEAVPFHQSRIKQVCMVGDQLIYEQLLPETIQDYPIIPFNYKWTGTPYPMSAVAPLIGKQQEINKAHQIMVHNASLGSSLRWMYEEGSIDAELWEKYSSSPGALLPIRPGVERPTPVMPAPLSSAFFQIVSEGKMDMEYLAGIYSSMMGDSAGAGETYRGMLAMDEYGTRRIKQWMGSCIEPALKQLGQLTLQFCQSVYTAQKRFRIVQPSAIQEGKTQEMNVPIYNDMGEAIGKSMDITAHKFDIRIISGSTLPVNRWAYLEELKQLMQLGVVDDIAVLAETDLKNKDKIVERKSLYSQLQGQLQSMEEALKDKEGTIETLSRQLVQAGIKSKVKDAEVEINKKKEEVKSGINKELMETQGKQKLLRGTLANNANLIQQRQNDALVNSKKDLENSDNSE